MIEPPNKEEVKSFRGTKIFCLCISLGIGKKELSNDLLDLDGYIGCGRRSLSCNDRRDYLLCQQKIVGSEHSISVDAKHPETLLKI